MTHHSCLRKRQICANIEFVSRAILDCDTLYAIPPALDHRLVTSQAVPEPSIAFPSQNAIQHTVPLSQSGSSSHRLHSCDCAVYNSHKGITIIFCLISLTYVAVDSTRVIHSESHKGNIIFHKGIVCSTVQAIRAT